MRHGRAKPVRGKSDAGSRTRVFPLDELTDVSPVRRWLPWALVAVVGVVLVVAFHANAVRAGALVGTAFALFMTRRAYTQVVAELTRVDTWLALDDEGIARVRSEPRGKTILARWDAPFGVSILANAAETRAMLVFTTPHSTRFQPIRLETPADADRARAFMKRAVTIADADFDLTVGEKPEAVLDPAVGADLILEIEQRSPHALSRLYLSDVRGSPLVVERDRLEVGERAFDLTSPVEWRVFTFQEGDAGAATLYQATSIRQGDREAVLVCRAPADLASWGFGRSPDAAPPRETRVAIDSLFMTPLRAVLAQAPRVSKPGAAPPRNRERAQKRETET